MCARVKTHLNECAGIYFNGSLIILGLLLVTEMIIILDFLPQLISGPENFPIKSVCRPNLIEIVPNFCSDIQSDNHLNFWKPCFIAQISANYTNSISGNQSLCRFFYPEASENTHLLNIQVKSEYSLNQSYDCWINLSNNHCYFLNNQVILSQFWISQGLWGGLLLLDLGFMACAYHHYKRRNF